MTAKPYSIREGRGFIWVPEHSEKGKNKNSPVDKDIREHRHDVMAVITLAAKSYEKQAYG